MICDDVLCEKIIAFNRNSLVNVNNHVRSSIGLSHWPWCFAYYTGGERGAPRSLESVMLGQGCNSFLSGMDYWTLF